MMGGDGKQGHSLQGRLKLVGDLMFYRSSCAAEMMGMVTLASQKPPVVAVLDG